MAPGEIQRGLTGAWRLMTGKADGMQLLDLSADGFWNSFFAIVIAVPALLPGWSGYANEIRPGPELMGARFALLPALAIIDIGTWVLPLVALALVARRIGIADRFVPYVVATNWGSALLVWLMVPAAILRLVAPQAADLATLISLLLFFASMALTWRLTTAAIGRGAAIGTAVFAGMFVASLLVLFSLQSLLGLSAAP
jgi:hypothetical protein